MTDHATPNLPSRDFEGTLQFYQKLGFDTEFRDDGWMILNRGDAKLEFFPHPELVPSTSSFSCCIRLDDMKALYQRCKDAGIPETCWGMPRVSAPKIEESGLTIAYLIDPDGTLLRLIQK